MKNQRTTSRELDLPQVRVIYEDSLLNEKFLLICGGRKPSSSWLSSLFGPFHIWAVDSGIGVCRKMNWIPEKVIGDADSARVEDWEWGKRVGASIQKFPVEKDLTDLQLALKILSENYKTPSVLVTGGWGGRFDHTWSNVLSLCWGKKWGIHPLGIVDHIEAFFFLSSRERARLLFSHTPSVISLLALSETCTGVSLSGVRWPLRDATLEMQTPWTVSNYLTASKEEGLRISIGEGMLGLYCCWGKRKEG